MARLLRFANITQTTTVDLWNGPVKLRQGGWGTRDAAPEGEMEKGEFGGPYSWERFSGVKEVMDLVGTATAGTALIAALGSIDAALEGARQYADDPIRGVSWWLEANAEGESPRRSMLSGGGALTYPGQGGISPLLEKNAIYPRLEFDRNPLWESTTAGTVSGTAISCAGGTLAVPAAGRLPGRVERLQIQGRSGGVGLNGPIYRIWAGIRPTYVGLDAYHPLWEAEAGAGLQDDTSEVDDAACSGAHKMVTTFAAGTAMINRIWSGLVSQIEGGQKSTDWLGSYLVLARARLTTSGTCGIRLSTGMAMDALAPCETQYVSGTLWRLWPMGEVAIPPFAYQSQIQDQDLMYYWKWAFAASRLSGTANLETDCLYFVPSRHLVWIEGAQVQYVVNGYCPLKVMSYENETHAAIWYRSIPSYEIPDACPAATWHKWYAPVDGGRFVIVAERSGEHVLTDTVDVTMTIYPRWKSFRGT